jgi:hypothetical protein
MKSKAISITSGLTIFGITSFFLLMSVFGTVKKTGAYESRPCGAGEPITVTCALITPTFGTSLTSSVAIEGDGILTVMVQITLSGQDYYPLSFYNQPGLYINTSTVEITTDVTGTLVTSTSAVISATNISLPLTGTNTLNFRVPVSSTLDVMAEFIINKNPPSTPTPTVTSMVTATPTPTVTSTVTATPTPTPTLSVTPTPKMEPRMYAAVIVKSWCPTAADCYEPNNNFADAKVLSPTLQTMTASVNLTTDRRDYYKVDFTSDAPYTITLKSFSGAGDLDLYVYDQKEELQCRSTLVNVSTEEIFINREPPCSANPSSAGKRLPKGTYYILVYVFSDVTNQDNRYTLSIRQ